MIMITKLVILNFPEIVQKLKRPISPGAIPKTREMCFDILVLIYLQLHRDLFINHASNAILSVAFVIWERRNEGIAFVTASSFNRG